MDYTLCAPRRTSRNYLKGRRDHCSLCQSALYTAQGQRATLNKRKQGHTSEVLRRRADRNGAIPQYSEDGGQMVATSAPLFRCFDAATKGVCAAGILFIGGHAPLDLPERK